MNWLNQTYIKRSGRSWWSLEYKDDTVKNEWQSVPGGSFLLLPRAELSRASEWENTNRKGVKRAVLYCPNGQAAAVEQPEDDKIFQFKVGYAEFDVSGNSASNSWCAAHVLGVVKDADGNCDYVAWEPPLKRLVTGTDNVHNFRYHNVGALAVTKTLELKI